MSITRRDFLNGVALNVAMGLSPAAQLEAAPASYPPALTGLRGQYDASFEIAHGMALSGRKFPVESATIEEHYDLVVVGGGISGLAAAYYYRRARPSAKILVLDNLDDFGGHAKRNEFTIDGRRIIAYGGSQSIQSPRHHYSQVAINLLRSLKIDLTRFQSAFERDLYGSLGLARGIFFAREAFNRDVLVPGDSLIGEADETELRRHNAKPIASFVQDFPISEPSKAQYVALFTSTHDPLSGKSTKEKEDILKHTSYREFLLKFCGCSDEVANCFQGRTLGFFGLGCDAVSAFLARDLGYPGFAGLKLPKDTDPAWKEPYIYHFPDGNASIARLLVRSLIPGIAKGRSMDDVVLAAFNYNRLDRRDQQVRIRLESTSVNVRNVKDKVQVAYVRNGTLHRVEARHAVLACFHAVIPYIMPELPDEQRAALAKNVKAPLVYTNVLVRNWRAFVNLKVSLITAPMSFHHQIALDYPVSLGGYRHSRDPEKPIVLHLDHIPGLPNQGADARTQFRAGRGALLTMTFEDFEAKIRDELDRILGPGGFSSARDIAAITVNRWSHGFSYAANSLFDPDDYDETVVKRARQKFGRVAIANTDAGGDAYVNLAIDHAARAVRELVG